MDKKTALAQEIRAFLRSNKMSQADFAKKVGCDPGAMSKYANGESYPRKHEESILDLLNITLEEAIRRQVGEVGEIDLDDRVAELRRFYGFSGDRATDRIHLVAASSGLVSVYKDYTARNYIDLDNYSDRDALLQVSVDLARCFPKSELKIWKANDFSEQNFSDCIVLFGGPSFGEHENNTVTDTFISERKIPLRFDDSAIIIKDQRFEFVMNDDGSVHQDFGVIVRFENMVRRDRVVVLVMGHFSWGVTAASSVMSLFAGPNEFIIDRFDLAKDQIFIFPMKRVLGRGIADLSQAQIIEF